MLTKTKICISSCLILLLSACGNMNGLVSITDQLLGSSKAAPTGKLAGYQPDMGSRLASYAYSVANDMQSTGWCFSGVAQAVHEVYPPFLSGASAYMAADQLALHPSFKEVSLSAEALPALPPGAVVVWGRTPASPHGHISVTLGDGREASDHVEAQQTSLRGASNYRVFIPVGESR